MPLYEYECTVCRKHTEKIQKFSDPEITACPHCGGQLQRVLSAPAIAFKGGGWYADGYASPKSPAESKPSESATASSESAPAASASAPAGTPPPASSSAPASATPSKT